MAVRPSLHPKHRPTAYLSRTQYKTRTSRTYRKRTPFKPKHLFTSFACISTVLIESIEISPISMAVRPSLHPKHRPTAYLSRTQYKTRTSRTYRKRTLFKPQHIVHVVRLYLNCSHRIYRDFTHFYGRSAVITPQTPPDRLPKPHTIQNTNFPHLPGNGRSSNHSINSRRSLVSQLFS
jgi:hypothetical protein